MRPPRVKTNMENGMLLVIGAGVNGSPVTTSLYNARLDWIIPSFLQIAGMRVLLNSKLGEVGLAWHVSQAPTNGNYHHHLPAKTWRDSSL